MPCTPHGAWSSAPLELYFVWETAAWWSVTWVGESFGGERVAWPSHPPSNLRAVLSLLNVVFPDPENEAVIPLALHLTGCLSIFKGHRLSPATQWLPSWLVVNLVEETLHQRSAEQASPASRSRRKYLLLVAHLFLMLLQINLEFEKKI